MKKFGRWICVLLVLALAAGLFGGMTAWAEDDTTPVDGTPVADGTQQQDVDAGNTSNAITKTNDPDAGIVPAANPSQTPPSTPPDSGADGGTVELVSYTVSPSHIENGQYFSMGMEIVDSRPEAAAAAATGNYPVATVKADAFPYRSVTGQPLGDNRYKIWFGDILYVGGTPTMTIEISYPNSSVPLYDGLSLTLTQCVDTPDATPTPEPVATPEPTYKTPGIIIRESSFGDAPQVQAGAEFTLSLTVFTTSGTENLSDVLITLTLPQGVSLATGNLNTYIGEMGPEATRTVTYQILPSATFVDGVANIGVSMSGIGQNSGGPASGSTSVSVPVVQPERFEITNIEAPETMMLGEEGYVSLTFVNKGKTAINNLSAEIRGDNLANPGQSQFLGNIAAGTENSVDFNVMAEQTGTINATIVLSYEDDAGNVKTLEKTFSCTVEEMPVYDDPGMMDPGMMDPSMGMEEPSGGMPWWGWVLILAAVGGGIAAVVVVLKKRKAKKALAQLEDQDEDL